MQWVSGEKYEKMFRSTYFILSFFIAASCSNSSSKVEESNVRAKVSKKQEEDTIGFFQNDSIGGSEIEQIATIDLVASKWEFVIAEGCINYIEFKDEKHYTEYDCEMGLDYDGMYKKEDGQVLFSRLDILDSLKVTRKYTARIMNVNAFEIIGHNNFKMVYERID